MGKEFKYTPDDFGALTVEVLHMDLLFDMFDDHTVVTSDLKLKAKEKIESLDLNAKKLKIFEVNCDSCDCTFDYRPDENILTVNFSAPIKKGSKFTISTKSECRPTSNVLEGLYYDETPEGAPPQQITQCQQWGFQRIVPCIDDMSAKCTYNSTIRADKRYTNVISNGDPEGVKDIGSGRVEAKYDNTITPMATYLFFLGAGTYATFKKEFKYPDGDSFMLELLVPPHSDPLIAEQALEIIYDSVLWVHLFTGPDKYKNFDRSLKAWNFMKEGKIAQAKDITKGLRLGYKYTGKVYREIGMQNSDFGGMENVGNTTITTNRIMPFPTMSDGAFVYMMRVKAHEYYHNLNGSEVTGWSPFEIWLNEAVTVHIEREFTEFFFGEDFTRLEEVIYIIRPHAGTLYQDASPSSMPIEPDGFNDPNELITGITYVKAPEFVRMIETLMGKEKFVEGLHLYHTRYKHSNATWMQWIEAMEETSGLKFKNMAKGWLKQTGYPTIVVTREVKNGNLILHLKQTGFKTQPYEFPFEYAVFDKEGNVVEDGIAHVKKEEHEIVVKNVGDIGFVSLNRGFSFYGKVDFETSEEELYLQVRNEDDIVNQFMAYDKIMDAERMRLLKNPDTNVSEEVVKLYFELLSNEELTESVGGQFLAIFDSVEDEKYAYKYQLLYDIKEKIITAVANKYSEEVRSIYDELAAKEYYGSVNEQRIASIKERQVKNVCLGILARLDTPDVHEILKRQFLETHNASDKITAFRLYLKSSAKDKMKLLKDYQEEASKDLVTWEIFLHAVASNEADDALDIIKKVEKNKHFRIDQANDQRALYSVFSHNQRKSLLTNEGRKFVKDSITKLAPVNEYNTLRILDAFGSLNKVDEEPQAEIVKMFIEILEVLDDEKMPSVTSFLKRMLKGSPKARKSYEKKYGKAEF